MARMNVVKIKIGDKFEMTEIVVVRRTMITDRTGIQFAYIICRESVIEGTIVHSRIMHCHLEKWSYVNSILWIVVQNETSASICIMIFLASSSIQV